LNDILTASFLCAFANEAGLKITCSFNLFREKVVSLVLSKFIRQVVVTSLLHEALVNNGIELLDTGKLGYIISWLFVILKSVENAFNISSLVAWSLIVSDVVCHGDDLLNEWTVLKKRADTLNNEVNLEGFIFSKVLALEGSMGVLDAHPVKSKVG